MDDEIKRSLRPIRDLIPDEVRPYRIKQGENQLIFSYKRPLVEPGTIEDVVAMIEEATGQHVDVRLHVNQPELQEHLHNTLPKGSKIVKFTYFSDWNVASVSLQYKADIEDIIQDWRKVQEHDLGVPILVKRLPTERDYGTIITELDDMPIEVPRVHIQAPKVIVNSADLRDGLTISIDPPGAKEIDDAIQYKKLREGKHQLTIHIADATRFVEPGSALDQYARDKGFTIYGSTTALPMLPAAIGNNLSLNSGVDRPAWSFTFIIDKDLEVIDYKMRRTIMRNDIEINYGQVPAIMHGKHELAPVLRNLDALSHQLMEKRVKRGSFKHAYSQSGKYIVHECMILTNQMVANHMHEHGLSIPFRNHHAPSLIETKKIIAALLEEGYDPNGTTNPSEVLTRAAVKMHQSGSLHRLEDLVDQFAGKAVYAPECTGHFGLKLEGYTHATSPLRRYADIVVHHQLNHLFYNEPPVPDEQMEQITLNLNNQRRDADKLREELILRDVATEYLLLKGNEYKGVVVNTGSDSLLRISDFDRLGIVDKKLKLGHVYNLRLEGFHARDFMPVFSVLK